MIPSPLMAWVNKKAVLPKRFSLAPDDDELPIEDALAPNWEVSVALDEVVPLHSIANANWESLSETRHATNEYLRKADLLIDGLWGGCLDSEERDLILENLGEPPPFCLPIYLVAVKSSEQERIVYVGKTRSSKRFSNGHMVGLKLHDPKYAQFEKIVYRCSVLLFIHDEYVALEWVEPEALAEKILDRVESVLIHAVQPELNIAKRRKPRVEMPIHIHVQNFADGDLLDGLMLWHKDDEPLSFALAKNMGSFK